MFFDRERNLGQSGADGNGARSEQSLRESYGIPNGDHIVLYTGTFEPYQGLDLLVDASQQVINARKDIWFLCAGGNENQIVQTKERARRHGVVDHFIFPGTLPPEKIDDLVKIASVLVSPRTSGTNTPLKIYSYLRSGVPILATKILSHTQVLSHQVALLVDPQPEAFASGVLKLLDDSHLRARLTQGALHLAREAYSEESYQRKVAEVFSFLAAAKSKTAS